MKKKKTYLLDTNILITSPYAITAFDEHDVSICDITLEELDKLKTSSGETGANAREAIRILDKFRQEGNLSDGVQMPLGGGVLKIEVNHISAKLPETWDQSRPDNRILRVCKGLKDDKKNVVLVSNDINMRIKADIIGVPAEEYKTEQMQKVDEQYKGRRELFVNNEVIDKLYKDGKVCLPDELSSDMTVNEFCLLRDETKPSHSALCRFDGKNLVPLIYEKSSVYGVTPKNVGQRFLQEALLADVASAPLVIVKGPAGTGKTLYALAAGLERVVNGYKEENPLTQILVSRPNIKFDEDIGFLKGTEEDKISPLIRPVMDNLKVLTKGKDKDNSRDSNYAQYLFDKGYVTAQALAYMRGRSISDTWLIIDECQNASPTQVFGIISRAGINSKVILVGDPEQIDNPRLDSRTNGLTYAAERMKGCPLCWQVTLEGKESVRSPLALEAIRRLSPKGSENIN